TVRSGASLMTVKEATTGRPSGAVIADAIDYGRGSHRETPWGELNGGEGTAIEAALRHSALAPVTLVPGRAASKSWLTLLSGPPMLLHLSTHGVYEPALGETDDPLELGSIALADANSDLGHGASGMMTAAE